ncbi:MAG: M48 family metalloprotease [Thermoanaerobaculia bacterium]|nr:M48 family metalloprotease [Thermoanaerobaculia bacterium]
MKSPLARRVLSVLVAVAFGVACVTNPVTGKSQLSLLGEEEEKRLGAEAYGPMIQESYGAVTDPGLQRFVDGVGQGLAKNSHRPALEYEFRVVNANYDNAFALPGGKICITRGLLGRMTTEDQLAGVMGHEIGHVTARHGAQQYTTQMLVGGLLGVGSILLQSEEVKGAPLIMAAAGIGGQLLLLRYSRDHERQSDELGMEYMVQAGYNPKGFVESMEILKGAHDREPSKLEAMFQSHPLTSERIETARQRAAARYPEKLGVPYRVEAFASATRNLKAEAPAFALMDEGEKLLAKKDARGAAAKFDEAARLAPRQAILPALKAIALVEAKEERSAREAAREAARRDPGLFHGRLAGGLAAFRLRDYRDALAELDAAEKAVGPQLVTVFYLGRSFEELGDRARAAEKFRLIAQSGVTGEQADYARQRLVEWGYATPAPAPATPPR